MSHPGILRRSAALLFALTLVLVACGEGEEAVPEAEVQTEEGEAFVVDGEEIADAELYAAAQEEGSLVVYSGFPEAAELAIQQAFSDDTGISVENVRAPTGQLVERILSEGGAGQLGADAIRISDIALVTEVDEAGIYAAHEIPNADVYEDQYKDPDGHWYASVIPTMGLSYNTELVSEDEAPASWEDMLDPTWQGNICVGQAGAGGSTFSWAYFQRVELGLEYWEALAEQDPLILSSTATVAEENARGECAVAINHQGTTALQMNDGAPLQFVFAEEGNTVWPHYLSLTAEAPNPNAGALFLNWSMSLRGQTVAATAATDFVPHPDAPSPALGDIEFPPLAEVEPYFADNDEWVEVRADWVQEWYTMFGYTP
ncbi:MAG: extracellular solute-binding protein [Euzebyales bacterium]|nr:extracellular solute-binding protein [Euzebyales bacterium]